MNDFNTTAEIWKWLLDGGSVSDGTCLFTLKDGFLITCNTGNRSYKFFDAPWCWKKDILPKWYEQTPLRRLCYVMTTAVSEVRVIVGIDPSTGYFEALNKSYWKNAIPLTNDEIMSFLEDSKQSPTESY